jgi:hypothetical protein
VLLPQFCALALAAMATVAKSIATLVSFIVKILLKYECSNAAIKITCGGF